MCSCTALEAYAELIPVSHDHGNACQVRLHLTACCFSATSLVISPLPAPLSQAEAGDTLQIHSADSELLFSFTVVLKEGAAGDSACAAAAAGAVAATGAAVERPAAAERPTARAAGSSPVAVAAGLPAAKPAAAAGAAVTGAQAAAPVAAAKGTGSCSAAAPPQPAAKAQVATEKSSKPKPSGAAASPVAAAAQPAAAKPVEGGDQPRTAAVSWCREVGLRWGPAASPFALQCKRRFMCVASSCDWRLTHAL